MVCTACTQAADAGQAHECADLISCTCQHKPPRKSKEDQ